MTNIRSIRERFVRGGRKGDFGNEGTPITHPNDGDGNLGVESGAARPHEVGHDPAGKEMKMHPPGTDVKSRLEDVEAFLASLEGKTEEEVTEALAALHEDDLAAIANATGEGEVEEPDLSGAEALFSAALGTDPLEFQKTFNELMAAKVGSAVEGIRTELATSIFSDEKPEEVETKE